MSKTKIVVIQLKEIIYTAIFVALGILLILLLVFMFLDKDDDATSTSTSQKYTAGVYTTSIELNDNVLDLKVVVDQDRIKSVELINLDEAITTMYPLVEPGLLEIESQLLSGADIESIELSKDSKYTQTILLDAIKATLEEASYVSNEEWLQD